MQQLSNDRARPHISLLNMKYMQRANQRFNQQLLEELLRWSACVRENVPEPDSGLKLPSTLECLSGNTGLMQWSLFCWGWQRNDSRKKVADYDEHLESKGDWIVWCLWLTWKTIQEELQEDARRLVLLLLHQDTLRPTPPWRPPLLPACACKALGGGARCWQTLSQANPEQLCHR